MYRIFDLVLDSDIQLPELPEVDVSGNGLKIRVSAGQRKKGPAVKWFHEWFDEEGEVVIRCSKRNDSYILQFPGLCEFLVNLENQQIEYMPEDDIPEETLRHLLLDQVVPRLLGQMGRMVLHASAITLSKNTGIAFVGNSGWGKSTIASAFYENGSGLLTDDCLLIETQDDGVKGMPNYHGLRLYSDSVDAVFGGNVTEGSVVAHYTDKKRLLLQEDGNSASDVPMRLSAIFLLNDPALHEPPNNISIESVSGAEEMMSIIKQMFVMDPADTELMAEQFMLVSKLISSQIPIFRLAYPRHHSQLAGVIRSVKEAITDNNI